MPKEINLEDIPDPGDRYTTGELLGVGVFGKVYSAVDSQAGNKRVAIKIHPLDKNGEEYIRNEYQVLRDLSEHPNIIDFYGVYRKKGLGEIWLVLELCEGGPIRDLVNGLLVKNRRMVEEHIAFVLKETSKALIFLHENKAIHRNICGNNILLSKEGEIKLADFSLSSQMTNILSKQRDCLGSPYWMAPEVIINSQDEGYGNKVDVWSLGITAIELGDGKPPFCGMHPTRAMFQIVRNPPPTLYRQSNWSEEYNDFVDECLIKNQDYRPFMGELIEHPFLAEVPENNYHLSKELKTLAQEYSKFGKEQRFEEIYVKSNFLVTKNQPNQRMLVEDLAALEEISTGKIMEEFRSRFEKKHFQTYIGDMLLVVNPNEETDVYTQKIHNKYKFKSSSDNPPHIFGVADKSYQYAMHHKTIQQIVLTGETGSGKTTNYLHLIDHLLYLGDNTNVSSTRIRNSVDLVHCLVHASTSHNVSSTRCVFRTSITFGSTGKVSGAIFGVHNIEKWRISSVDMEQPNFNILYYFYDAQLQNKNIEKYNLNTNRSHRYLRIYDNSSIKQPRNDKENNIKMFENFDKYLKEFDFDEHQIDTIYKVFASILILGDIRFEAEEDGTAKIDTEEFAERAATLLEVDSKKLTWALTNYCLVKKNTAIRKKNSCDKARSSRDVLANNLYSKLVDYIVNVLNYKLSMGRTIFGENYCVKIMDLYGFESFRENHLPQFFVNCFNEQLQYYYLQHNFSLEAVEINEEDVPFVPIHFYNNKSVLDQIFKKPEGLISLIDDASRKGNEGIYIVDHLREQNNRMISTVNPREFSIAHYTGKVIYDTKEMPDRNKDFLPPELIEVLRSSENVIIKTLFISKLNKIGNLQPSFEATQERRKTFSQCEDQKHFEGQYSQIKKMRTSCATFRALSLHVLKELSAGSSTGSVHFIRCLRSNLNNAPFTIQEALFKQQLKALCITETARARQRGFSHRISFNEFLRRYKFLAFDFDENVEVSKDNCRLLLVRLKMEGWAIGKSKVLLKYYSEEYLSRLYEIKVKKIVKIQSIIRSYLVKRKMRKQTAEVSKYETHDDLTEEKAAIIIQKAYKKHSTKKRSFDDLDEGTCEFMKYYCKKWKAKTIFQVLLQYRAVKFQDLINLSQQVHLYNQSSVNVLQKINAEVNLNYVDSRAQISSWIGEKRPAVLKIPFRLDEIPFFDTSYMCDPLTNPSTSLDVEEKWDTPFLKKETVSLHIATSTQSIQEDEDFPTETFSSSKLMELPFTRDPDDQLTSLSDSPELVETVYPKTPLTSNCAPSPIPKILEKEQLSPCTDSTTTNADKDFEYIKTPQIMKKVHQENVNPIVELKNLGRKENVSDEEPPFNFQKMLRKTNYVRDSLKRMVPKVDTSDESEINGINGGMNSTIFSQFSGELVPGLYIEGVVVDL